MNFVDEKINIVFLKQIIMVIIQVVAQLSKRCCNLKYKKMVVNRVVPCFNSKGNFGLLVVKIPIFKSFLSNSL